jgi:hypothetical protein
MNSIVTRSALRDAMLESLRRESPSQFSTFKSNTAKVLTERGLYQSTASIYVGFYEYTLSPQDERRFRELLWSFINSGVLVQGLNAANPNWPFLSLTEMGEKFVKSGSFDVYDPDGYLIGLSKIRDLDAVERRFAGQAVGALNGNLPDAAAVMVGAAAEHVVRLLCAAIGESDASVKSKVDKLESQPAAHALNFVIKYTEDRKTALDRTVREQLSTTFGGVAAMIRASRNDAGHPALGVVDYDHALVLLQLFPGFRKMAYSIIDALPISL